MGLHRREDVTLFSHNCVLIEQVAGQIEHYRRVREIVPSVKGSNEALFVNVD
jgi:hypothetical protein